MSAKVNFSFECRDYSASNGKIIAECEVADADPHNFNFHIGIISPSGATLKALPASADVSALAAPNKSSVSVDIPVDSNGDYLGGTYTFQVRRVNNSTGADTTVEVEYTFDPKVYDEENFTGVLSLNAAMNYITGKVTGEDDNDYTALGLTFISRTLKITPPTVDTQSVVSTTDADAEMSVAYSNVSYNVHLDSEFSWGSETLDESNPGDISCICRGTLLLYNDVEIEGQDEGICEGVICLENLMNELNTKACDAGGYEKLSQADKDKLTWAGMNLMLARFEFVCGRASQAVTFANRAKETLDCSCGCGEDTSNVPVPYTAPTA